MTVIRPSTGSSWMMISPAASDRYSRTVCTAASLKFRRSGPPGTSGGRGSGASPGWPASAGPTASGAGSVLGGAVGSDSGGAGASASSLAGAVGSDGGACSASGGAVGSDSGGAGASASGAGSVSARAGGDGGAVTGGSAWPAHAGAAIRRTRSQTSPAVAHVRVACRPGIVFGPCAVRLVSRSLLQLLFAPLAHALKDFGKCGSRGWGGRPGLTLFGSGRRRGGRRLVRFGFGRRRADLARESRWWRRLSGQAGGASPVRL